MKSQEIEPEASASETFFAEAREFARQLLEERERSAFSSQGRDSFFEDRDFWKGPTPGDVALRHDEYLYGKKS